MRLKREKGARKEEYENRQLAGKGRKWHESRSPEHVLPDTAHGLRRWAVSTEVFVPSASCSLPHFTQGRR